MDGRLLELLLDEVINGGRLGDQHVNALVLLLLRQLLVLLQELVLLQQLVFLHHMLVHDLLLHVLRIGVVVVSVAIVVFIFPDWSRCSRHAI